jgi:hypothetical protein
MSPPSSSMATAPQTHPPASVARTRTTRANARRRLDGTSAAVMQDRVGAGSRPSGNGTHAGGRASMMKSMSQPSLNPWHEEVSILEHGLPSLPATLGHDEAVPVARWIGRHFGAVLVVEWSEDGTDAERYLSSEIYVFERVEHRWESMNTGGGGGWFDPPFVRPKLAEDFAALMHFHSCGDPAEPTEGLRWRYASAYGYAGTAAKTVEVEDDDGIAQREIESPLGVFIVVADGTRPAVVRVRRGDGSLLLAEQFSPPT